MPDNVREKYDMLRDTGSVFDQYQKYYESQIAEHKTACQLENQNHQLPQQQPQQQQPTQQQQPPQQQPLLYPNTQNIRRQQQIPPLMPTYWQPEMDTFRMAPPPQPMFPMMYPQRPMYRQTYGAPECCYYGRCSELMQLQQQQFEPDYFNGRSVDKPQTTAGEEATSRPAETAAAATPSAAEPNSKQQQAQCYPFGMTGYQGGGPCGPCTSCNSAPLPPSAAPAGSKKQNCPGNKDCNSGWTAGESAAKANRLPLGAEEPFIVGPTTYQFFFDRPA